MNLLFSFKLLWRNRFWYFFFKCETEILFGIVTRLDKGVIVYIADSMGVRDIYDTNGSSAISTKEPLAVLVSSFTNLES